MPSHALFASIFGTASLLTHNVLAAMIPHFAFHWAPEIGRWWAVLSKRKKSLLVNHGGRFRCLRACNPFAIHLTREKINVPMRPCAEPP